MNKILNKLTSHKIHLAKEALFFTKGRISDNDNEKERVNNN